MFRFTIRDVLWLMVVVGLVFGWGVDRKSFARRVLVRINTDDPPGALLPGEKFEVEALPNGKFTTRTVPAKK